MKDCIGSGPCVRRSDEADEFVSLEVILFG